MPRSLLILFAVLLGAAAFRAPTERDPLGPVAGIAEQRLTVAAGGGTGTLPIALSQDWTSPLPRVTLAVVTIHGIERNVTAARTVAENALGAARVDPNGVLLIEPQFLDEVDLQAHSVADSVLRWSRTGWENGQDASGPVPISSFAALDAILAQLADRRRFPALARVVVAGHSGGGQLVQRYAAAGHGGTALAAAGVSIRYVIANPSSYLYFTADRPSGKFFPAFDPAACPTFNHWRYGLEDPPPYLAGADAAALERDYVGRDIVYLLGTEDTDPHHPTLDTSCGAEEEGPYRLLRGLGYVQYLEQRHKTGLAHRVMLVKGVGHDAKRMFESACGIAAVYDRSGC
jgi:pimeloyl-ACP methyl ester carboxylesterase